MIYYFSDHPTGLGTVGLILSENSCIIQGLHCHVTQEVLVFLLIVSSEVDNRTLKAMIQNHYSYEAVLCSCLFFISHKIMFHYKLELEIVRSHVGWGGERSIFYKGVETSL